MWRQPVKLPRKDLYLILHLQPLHFPSQVTHVRTIPYLFAKHSIMHLLEFTVKPPTASRIHLGLWGSETSIQCFRDIKPCQIPLQGNDWYGPRVEERISEPTKYFALRTKLTREAGLVRIIDACFISKASFIIHKYLNPMPPSSLDRHKWLSLVKWMDRSSSLADHKNLAMMLYNLSHTEDGSLKLDITYNRIACIKTLIKTSLSN